MSEVKVNKISPRTNCGTVTVGDAGDSVTVTAGVPVTVNGDLKSNALKAVDGGSIISQSGTTITLGASGDTINLAAGASQTGFGRTGTVDWDTTAKTASFTAVSGNGYFVNTTSGALTVTLPASPSAGDIVAVSDYAGTAATNNITIARNGSNLEGSAEDGKLETNRESKTLVYVDGTQGWVPVNDNADSLITALFVTATGGTITTCGDYKIHRFTGPGTFTVSCAGNAVGSNSVDYLVVAGGGGGAADAGGGGGAGGFRTSSGSASGCYATSPLGACVSALPVSVTGYPITVGGGASGTAPPASPRQAGRGSNSVFSTITSTGGGGGNHGPCGSLAPGGSGGGGRCVTGGTGNTPPVSPPQGNPGGNNCGTGRGGGGGAGGAGANGTSPQAGPGGTTTPSAISGTTYHYAGGGGAGNDQYGSAGVGGGPGTCGSGGDGKNRGDAVPGESANANGGGGGGGGGAGSPATGGNGGSGVVVIRYKYQ